MALKARLHIETALQNERTILKRSFCTPPFKIADVTEDRTQNGLRLMVMSSSPGVLDGDDYHLRVDVSEKCFLEMQTQSYQRLFQMKKGASQLLDLHLKDDSSFLYIPHPLVPHEKSSFTSMNRIVMDESCSLVWGEVLSCGRKMNGEVFKFSSYHSITEVFFGEKLVMKENILMRPSEMDLQSIGLLEGYTHQASLVCIEQRTNFSEKAETICNFLNQHQHVEFGVSALPVNGIIVRLLGYKAEQLFELLKTISSLLSRKTAKEFYVS